MVNIGKVIFEKCKNFVEGRCYPLIAEETTVFPFVVYVRESTIITDTKDKMICSESHTIQINIVTDRYDQGVFIAERICNQFENLNGVICGINVVDTKINNISEVYANGAYIQTITINIKTN